MPTLGFFREMYRCRLCATLFETRHLEPSLEAAQFELSENSGEGLAHKEHLCNDGGVGIADIAGYQKLATDQR